MTSFAMRTSFIGSRSVCGMVWACYSFKCHRNCSVAGFRKTVLVRGLTLLSLRLCKIAAFATILPDSMKI